MRSRKFFRSKVKASKDKLPELTDTDYESDEELIEDSARYTDTSWQIHKQLFTGGGGRKRSASSSQRLSRENGVPETEVAPNQSNTAITTAAVTVHNTSSDTTTTPTGPSTAAGNTNGCNHVSSAASTSSSSLANSVTSDDPNSDTTLHIQETTVKNGTKIKQTTAVMTSQPRASFRTSSSSSRNEGMDLSYVTERIIALSFPGDVAPSIYRQGQRQAAHMLHNKHGDNYMVFNLSEPRRAARSEHERVREVGWPSDLAPPLERLCSICKDIDSWLSTDKQRIAVLHANTELEHQLFTARASSLSLMILNAGSRERLGVVVAAYMHYSSICGTADQALDRFAMRRFLDDTVGPMELPSNKRYVEYFSGLLSGNIRINAAPLYLTHVTVLGAPAFDAPGGCRAFLKVYEGLVPVYTSGIYSVSGGMRQFTVNVASERQRRGLQLRGDILVKCYHRRANSRETIFSCQFHTCAVSDYTLSFTRQELDAACNDLRFPLDGAVELHFSPTPETRLPSPAPTPAVPVELTDDRIVRYDSYQNLAIETTEDESEPDTTDADVNHTYGPLDGSIYATIAKKADLSPGGTGSGGDGGGVISSPLTVSMDSGISSAGHQQASHGAPLSNNTSNESSSSPPPGGLTHSSASGGGGAPLTPEDRHRELDELLSDMLLTVESIPDVKQRSQPPRGGGDVSLSSRGAPTTISAGSRSYTQQPRNGGQSANGLSCEETLQSVIHTLDSVSYIDDDSHNGRTLDDIPYHARQDSRPFTYGPLPAEGSMLGTQTGLASPSLVRKASFGKSSPAPPYEQRNGGDTLRRTNSSPYKRDPIEDIFTARANESLRRDDYRQHETLRRSNTEGTLRRPATANGYSNRTTTSCTTPVTSPYSDSESLSPPSGFGRPINHHQRHHHTMPRSPNFIESSFSSTSTSNNSNLTWLQRQQQKLKERREIQLREERQPHETRLISELRSMQHTTHRHMRPTASHRLDGYTSDTTAFADDDDDFTIPLHINTTTASGKLASGGALSPLLPDRTTSRKYSNSISQTSTLSSRSATNERPFVAVKRAHEFNSAQNTDMSAAAALAAHPLGHAITRPESRSADSVDSGLLSMVEHEQQQQQRAQSSQQRHNGAYREESFSSWRTATSASDADGSPPPTSTSPRPQTPAFPVHPRTPYSNNSVHFDLSQGGLPPKSPTTLRRMSYPSTTIHKNAKKWCSESPSKDIHVSPITNGNSSEYTTMQQHQTITSSHSSMSNGTLRGGGMTPTTPNSSSTFGDTYQQHSPRSPTANGSSSPTVYYGHSRRSSVHSNSEPPQEVSAAHVKFVRDTSKLWYKPTITREEAISLLRNQPPGTFVVRDSNSFPNAFGMALKVATPPANVQTKSNGGDELVRHFLIEPTSRGVRLKGCSNEPVFSSLSALVYQHSVIPLALPCRLTLPEGDSSRIPEAGQSLSTAQQLLTQGAACNVLYLFTVDMESLTGPQAIRKAVLQLFMQRPLPKASVVHFKVYGQGITLTDNKRKLFFRRHYPSNTISYCGLDPDDHRWSHSNDETGMPISSNRCFGFVARKPASSTDNQCHVFAELEPEQPATAIVNFVSKVIMTQSQGKANIV